MDFEIIDNVIQNTNFPFHIIDHPMKPFGMRYWEILAQNSFNRIDDFLGNPNSGTACSWLRDQEYMVDSKYYEDLELPDGNLTNYLHVFPKVRSVRMNECFP